MKSRTAVLITICGAALLSLRAPEATAAWEFVPSVVLELESNDNPRLRADDPALGESLDDAATRILADISAELVHFSERGQISFEPALRSDAYADAVYEELQSTDVYLRSAGRYEWERKEAGYSLDLSRERILGAEFLGADGDPTVVDGTLVGLNERRTRAVLSPFTQFETGDRGALRLDGRFMDVAYDDEAVTTRSDFTDLMIGLEYLRRTSERSTFSGRIFASSFEADANLNETDTAGIEMGVLRTLSDVWSLNLALGVQRSDFLYFDASGARITGTDDNVSARVGFDRSVELASFSFDLIRQVNPDSFGFLAVRDQLRLALRRQMSPTVDGIFAVRAIDSRGIDGAAADGADAALSPAAGNDYARLELGLDWSVSPLWSVLVGYQYSLREVESVAADASSNTLSVGVNYRGRSQR